MDKIPELNHWWDYPKEDIMTCIYWSQNQLPPSDKKIYNQEWENLKIKLIEKYGNKPKEKYTIKQKMYCCNKKMLHHDEGLYCNNNFNIEQFDVYICKECGKVVELKVEYPDEEEIENMIEYINKGE